MACHVDWVAFVALRPCHKTFRAGQVGVTRVGRLPPVFIAYGNTPEEIVDRIDMQLVQECGTFGADAAQKLYGLCKDSSPVCGGVRGSTSAGRECVTHLG